MVDLPPRAIGIVRVSQRDDDTGHSPEVQAGAMLRQARDDGFALAVDDIWDENIADDGKVRKASGGAALADRPKLRAAVEAVERREAQVIVAERFDRLFRDLDVQREVIRRVEAAGGRLVTAAGQISHATAESELQANLNGAIAQYTKRTAIERSKAAVQIAINNGIAPFGRVTAGYWKREDGTFEPDPDLAPVVTEAFAMRAAGRTVDEAWKHLRAGGITITYAGAYALLKSRVVLGEIHFGKFEPNLTAHPPIVDRDTWNAAQKMRSPKGRHAQSERLLARLGILRCGTCNSRMAGSTARGAKSAGGGGGRTYPIYRCGNKDCARQMSIMAQLVDDTATEVVQKVHERLAGDASIDDASRAADIEADQAQADLDGLIRVLAIVGDEAAAVARIEQAAARRDAAVTEAERLRGLAKTRKVDISRWDEMTPDARRQIVTDTLARVVVGPGRGLGRLSFEFLLQ